MYKSGVNSSISYFCQLQKNIMYQAHFLIMFYPQFLEFTISLQVKYITRNEKILYENPKVVIIKPRKEQLHTIWGHNYVARYLNRLNCMFSTPHTKPTSCCSERLR